MDRILEQRGSHSIYIPDDKTLLTTLRVLVEPSSHQKAQTKTEDRDKAAQAMDKLGGASDQATKEVWLISMYAFPAIVQSLGVRFSAVPVLVTVPAGPDATGALVTRRVPMRMTRSWSVSKRSRYRRRPAWAITPTPRACRRATLPRPSLRWAPRQTPLAVRGCHCPFHRCKPPLGAQDTRGGPAWRWQKCP